MKAPLRTRSVFSFHDARKGTTRQTVCEYNSHETGRQENDGVDNTDDPFIFAFAVDPESFREGQVGTVGTGLIPTLGGGSDGAQADRVPEHLGAMPLVILFVLEGVALVVLEFVDAGEVVRVAGDEGGATKEVCMLGHAVGLGERHGIEDRLFRRSAL